MFSSYRSRNPARRKYYYEPSGAPRHDFMYPQTSHAPARLTQLDAFPFYAKMKALSHTKLVFIFESAYWNVCGYNRWFTKNDGSITRRPRLHRCPVEQKALVGSRLFPPCQGVSMGGSVTPPQKRLRLSHHAMGGLKAHPPPRGFNL